MFSIPFAIGVAYFAAFALALLWVTVANITTKITEALRARRFAGETWPSEAQIVVTLVHGTWARRATWTGPDSSLRHALSSATDASITFQRFVWSGRNSISARRRAVKDLIAYLHAQIMQWPQARHYVVAHSHGGNLALQALGDPALKERVAGFACLSTPFLVVSPRNLGPAGATALWWLPVVIVFYSGMFVIEQTPASHNMEILGPVLLLVAVGIGFLVSRLLTRFSASVLQSFQCPAVDPSKILILRTNGDEAAGTLGATHAISWATGGIWLITSTAVGRTVATLDQWRRTLVRHWLMTTLITAFLICVSVGTRFLASPTDERAWLESIFGLSVLLALLIIAILVNRWIAGGIWRPHSARHDRGAFSGADCASRNSCWSRAPGRWISLSSDGRTNAARMLGGLASCSESG